MVTAPGNSSSAQTQQYTLTIKLHTKNLANQDVILSALKPELASIDSKRVALQVKSNQNQIVFHLAAKDATALRAAVTSLVRLYLVADGVHQFTVMKNG